jgi:small conductance mechanosensitive channel
MENLSMETIIKYVTDYGIPVLKAIAIYIIGSWVIKKIMSAVKAVMSKKDYDESLQKFLVNLIGWALKIFLIITVVGTLGVETTSFAGGVLLMIFKPYKIGDLIEAQDVLGVVKEIEIFTTKLVSPENKLVIVPNGAMANGNITNYTAEGKIRVDTVIGVAYEEDIKQVKDVLLEVLTSNPKVLKDPAPSVNVMELADSSVNFAVRPFAKPEDYWDVYFATYENCKIALDKAGIEIPYPHEVEVIKQAK